MRVDLYKIDVLSNLHVGSGDINFDIVDNQVQKDLTNLPIIHSSSLKGAFREHFENMGDSKTLIKYIFGAENNSNEIQAGAYSFFEAQLLTRPVRSNVKPYFNATSPDLLKNLIETIDNFDIEFDEKLKEELKALSNIKIQSGEAIIFEKIDRVILEDIENIRYNNQNLSEDLKQLLGDNLALFSFKDFKNLSLPVLARNHLENGVSKNLWYEEVVPKKSKFFFCIAKPTNVKETDKTQKIDGFENRFNNDGSKIQIGGNKSIGYGFTKIQKVSK